MTTEHYPNLVIGGGEAGKYLAWTLAKLGQKTVVIERAMIGGSCPNIACLPSKNIIYSAKAVSLAGRAAEFGISTGPVKVDMSGVFARKRKMVEALIQMNFGQYQATRRGTGDGRSLFHRTEDGAGGVECRRYAPDSWRPGFPERSARTRASRTCRDSLRPNR